MRLATVAALLLCLLVASAPAETITIEIELPANPGGEFDAKYIRALMIAMADRVEGKVNSRRARLYTGDDTVDPPLFGECGNWRINLTDAGVCDYLPMPPNKLAVTATWQDVGWGLSFAEKAEALTDICQLDNAFVARMPNVCKAKLGISDPPPPPSGVVQVMDCYPRYGNRCQAGPADTVTHGTLVDGSQFPDGKQRFKFVGTAFGRQTWYQIERP